VKSVKEPTVRSLILVNPNNLLARSGEEVFLCPEAL